MLVRVWEDGKIGRGVPAYILKRKGKRILIRFYDTFNHDYVSHWFVKVSRRDKGVYYDKLTNNFYYPIREREAFKEEMRNMLTPECFTKTFGN